MKRIVTHPGTAHGDDFLTCCVLAAKFGVPIYRREPTQADLDNIETLVLDVGGKHEPEKLNFDHHQDLQIPCSLVLVLQWLGLHEKFQHAYKWYVNVDFRDRNGADALGKKYGLSAEQMAEIVSPVHTALLTMFEKKSSLLPSIYQTHFPDILYPILAGIGKELIEYAENYGAAWERLELCARQNFYGYEVMINPSDDITATGDYMRERKIAIMCSHDNRGAGWAILRSNDFPQINLAPLADNPLIAFAHKGGFIAKTKERVESEVFFELLKPLLPK